MSVKKNLTVAGLAALLAIPTLGATNFNHNLHVPSVTAHADTRIDGNNYGGPTGPFLRDLGGKTSIWQRTNDGPSPSGYGSYGGHHYDFNPATSDSIWVDGQKMSASQAQSILDGTNNTNNPNTSNQYNQGNTSSDQYSSNSLPQTGEINHQASELAASIVLGATGVGLGAMTMKKHKKDKDIASVTPIQTNSSSNNDNNKVNNIIDTLGAETHKLNNYIHQISNK